MIILDCIIGLDIGTSAVKGAIMTAEGKILNTISKSFTYFGNAGEFLLDPDMYCNICMSVIRELSFSVKKDHCVAAICSCCASGNMLLLDENNNPLTPIIGWQTNIEGFSDTFSSDEKAEFHQKIGWPLGNSFSPAWRTAINKKNPELLKCAKSIVMSAEFLNYKLTGNWGISNSMGTPFFIIDQEKGEYWIDMLEKLNIADKFLPPIYKKGTCLGSVTTEIAALLGLKEDCAVILGSFDHPSGALGAGVFEEGDMLLSCGTSWVELFPVSSREKALSVGPLVDHFMLNGSPYCVMSSISSISAKIDKLRKHFFPNLTLREFDTLAISGDIGCGGLTFTFTDDDFLLDLKEYSPQNIARAIIESSAIILKNNLSTIRQKGIEVSRIVAIGGSTNSKECVEIISTVLCSSISVINGQSAGAVGSCLLGGIGIGVFKDEKAAFKLMANHLS